MTKEDIILMYDDELHAKASDYASNRRDGYLAQMQLSKVKKKTQDELNWIWVAHYEGYKEGYWAQPEQKTCGTCEALARTVMLDQTSHDTQRKPLTDEEVIKLKMEGRDLEFVSMTALHRFARAIEAAHGIKEGT